MQLCFLLPTQIHAGCVKSMSNISCIQLDTFLLTMLTMLTMLAMSPGLSRSKICCCVGSALMPTPRKCAPDARQQTAQHCCHHRKQTSRTFLTITQQASSNCLHTSFIPTSIDSNLHMLICVCANHLMHAVSGICRARAIVLQVAVLECNKHVHTNASFGPELFH